MVGGRRVDWEHQEQVALVRWFDLQYPKLEGKLFAVPNGGFRHKLTALKLRAEGLRPGVPDLVLPMPRHGYHGLYIELKTKTGKPSELQEEWVQFLNDQGYLAEFCYGWESARDLIKKYLAEG